jgi:hypothetical protein
LSPSGAICGYAQYTVGYTDCHHAARHAAGSPGRIIAAILNSPEPWGDLPPMVVNHLSALGHRGWIHFQVNRIGLVSVGTNNKLGHRPPFPAADRQPSSRWGAVGVCVCVGGACSAPLTAKYPVHHAGVTGNCKAHAQPSQSVDKGKHAGRDQQAASSQCSVMHASMCAATWIPTPMDLANRLGYHLACCADWRAMLLYECASHTRPASVRPAVACSCLRVPASRKQVPSPAARYGSCGRA